MNSLKISLDSKKLKREKTKKKKLKREETLDKT
jgi:hypothetical protein